MPASCSRSSTLETAGLIAVIKKELKLKASLYTLLQILSVSTFAKTQLSCALQADDYEIEPLPASKAERENKLTNFLFIPATECNSNRHEMQPV